METVIDYHSKVWGNYNKTYNKHEIILLSKGASTVQTFTMLKKKSIDKFCTFWYIFAFNGIFCVYCNI